MGNEQSIPQSSAYHFRNQPHQPPSTQQRPVQRNFLPPDPYVFFGLTLETTEEQAKRAYYRKVREHHPDRGGDPQLFAWIHQAYIKVLHEVQERSRRITDEHTSRRQQYQQIKSQQENLAVATQHLQNVYQQEQEPIRENKTTTYQPPTKPAGPEPKFQAEKFNQIFEETRMKRPSDRGYGNAEEFDRMMNQLPQQPTMTAVNKLSGASHDQFMNQFTSHKQQWTQNQTTNDTTKRKKEIAKYRGPEALVSTSFASCEELGNEDKDDFTAPMQSSLAYTDYMGAYTRYNQLEENQEVLQNRPTNLENYKAERENIRFNLNPEEQSQMEAIRVYEEEQEKLRVERMQEEDRLAALQHEKAKKFYLQGRKK